VNTTLTSLDITSNRITQEALRALSSGLIKNRTLEILKVTGVYVSVSVYSMCQYVCVSMYVSVYSMCQYIVCISIWYVSVCMCQYMVCVSIYVSVCMCLFYLKLVDAILFKNKVEIIFCT